MTQFQREDTLALIASAPEHCLDCFHLFSPGDRPYEGADVETETMASNLVIDCGGGLIVTCTTGCAIVARTQEVRHLVDALVEGAARVVDEQV